MKASNLKGALLEYIIRNLLKNCGFTNVNADNMYSFERGGLFFINGKGAAHDADVIMSPPIQMPFSYPTQLLFECKAYGATVGLPIVRNALGLRNDINDFEIVTEDSLLSRQNNRRADYAIKTRKRYIYQVGVASINKYSKPSIEFATNNKIPLLSLSWFLGANTIRLINDINQVLIDDFIEDDIKNTYDFFKDREGKLQDEKYNRANIFLNSGNNIGAIVTSANTAINYSYVGVLETGDMVFLFKSNSSQVNILSQLNGFNSLKAEIHWFSNRPNVWRLTVFDAIDNNTKTDYDFFVPERIFNHWKELNLDKSIALDIKQQFFSKIFIFNQRNNPEIPFSLINIDKEWLEQIRYVQENE